MKNIIIFSIILLTIGLNATAQEISIHALGLRLGNNDGLGAEISYQRKLSENNRAEFDFGYRNTTNYDAIKLTGIYQWIWNIEGDLNWYAGVGAGLGSYSVTKSNGFDGNSGAFFDVVGDIGIEYLFKFPLQVSLDFRPEFYFGKKYRNDNFGSDLALSIRYRF